MARYKVSFTVYKDPAGKTMAGPTAVHFLGDLCSAFGLFGVLGVILALIENYGVQSVIGSAVLAVAGFVLMVLFHKQAKKSAEAKFLETLAWQEGQAAVEKKG